MAALMFFDHLLDLSFGRGRKIFFDIGFADGVRKREARGVQRLFIARALLRRSAKRSSVKCKSGVAERLRQHVGRLIERMECKPVLPALQRLGSGPEQKVWGWL